MTPSDLLQLWAKVLDQDKCIGCHACTTACKSENEVPLGVTRTHVKSAEVGTFPQVRRAFQVTRCNQCADAPCTTACPTEAMYRRADGIIDFDKSACIGCKACIAASPYDTIFINPEDNSAEKCNLCAHRLDIGPEPACVTVCLTEAILVGDLNDPESKVAQIINREAVTGLPSGEGSASGDPGPARGPAAGSITAMLTLTQARWTMVSWHLSGAGPRHLPSAAHRKFLTGLGYRAWCSCGFRQGGGQGFGLGVPFEMGAALLG